MYLFFYEQKLGYYKKDRGERKNRLTPHNSGFLILKFQNLKPVLDLIRKFVVENSKFNLKFSPKIGAKTRCFRTTTF